MPIFSSHNVPMGTFGGTPVSAPVKVRPAKAPTYAATPQSQPQFTNPFTATGTAPVAGSTAVRPSGTTAGFSGTAGGGTAGQFGANLPAYTYGGLPQADIYAQNAMTAMGQTNPYNNAFQAAALSAGNAAGGQGQANIGQADMLRGGASSVMNTAFDPQNALRSREEQALLDKVRVGQAARGITSSPYGANLEAQALSNFGLDWQDRQLGRQTSGLSAAGMAGQQGAGLGQTGVEQTQAVGEMPWQSYEQQQKASQQAITNWLNYLQGGSQAFNASSGVPVMQPMPSSIIFGGNMSPGYTGR